MQRNEKGGIGLAEDGSKALLIVIASVILTALLGGIGGLALYLMDFKGDTLKEIGRLEVKCVQLEGKLETNEAILKIVSNQVAAVTILQVRRENNDQ